MKIGILKETNLSERRVCLLPVSIDKLIKNGAQVVFESGLGSSLGIDDQGYQSVGATVMERAEILSSSDIVVRLRKPELKEIPKLKKGSIHVSLLDPFNELPLLDAFVQNQITAISMEMIPRSTLAQKMDVLSSQANLAGYVSVVIAAERLDKILPMMMTPSGTISPARVFVIGAGVAGLQAIATAKRLGARVDAFDTRDVVEEQVRSLGAKFVKIDLGVTGQTKDGYAKALTEDQIELQRQGMAKACAQSDIVITTALLFGRKAPRVITKDMIEKMKPGSVIIDMAVETGGNVEGSILDEEVTVNGVRIVGLGNLPACVAINASEMLSNNFFNLLESFWDKEQKTFVLNLEDDILKGCVITHLGKIVNEMIRNHHGS